MCSFHVLLTFSLLIFFLFPPLVIYLLVTLLFHTLLKSCLCCLVICLCPMWRGVCKWVKGCFDGGWTIVFGVGLTSVSRIPWILCHECFYCVTSYCNLLIVLCTALFIPLTHDKGNKFLFYVGVIRACFLCHVITLFQVTVFAHFHGNISCLLFVLPTLVGKTQRDHFAHCCCLLSAFGSLLSVVCCLL